MFRVGVPELVLILAIVLLVFGAGKLPALGQGLGQSIRGFRRALRGDDEAPSPPMAGPAKEDRP